MKVVASNRRAKFDYDIQDTMEVGIVLTGQEVKSCRNGNVSLAGAYVSLRAGAPVLKQTKISLYVYASPSANAEYNPTRDRELLLKKSDIEKLKSIEQEKGMAIVPLEVRAGRHIKVLLGYGRGRKKIDKRQRIRERETKKKLRKGEDI